MRQIITTKKLLQSPPQDGGLIVAEYYVSLSPLESNNMAIFLLELLPTLETITEISKFPSQMPQEWMETFAPSTLHMLHIIASDFDPEHIFERGLWNRVC